ncbi:MAG TPA: ACT domain-containing protein [Opitutaceae bacterium]|nr:glycine cleavage system protein R [Opitutaceae bacterium]HRE05790.1 ACT domain-containing protein [Opitutaceae bacterium]
MRISLVITVIGADRPGLVESVAWVVADCGGNWLDSRMARLGGQFAGMVRVELPAERESALRSSLAAMQEKGLTVMVGGVSATDAAPGSEGRTSAHLELVGQDRPGIVRQITGVLVAHAVNVEELTTGTESAPMSGGLLFRAVLEVSLPPGLRLEALRADLEEIAADLMVDVDLKPTST